MNRVSRLMTFIWLVLPAVSQSGEAGVQALQPQSVGKTQPQAPRLVVIDVRTSPEYSAEHILGTTNVPLAELQQRIKAVVPEKKTPVAVHCRSGSRSAKAKKILEDLGYKNVRDFGSLESARGALEAKSRAP